MYKKEEEILGKEITGKHIIEKEIPGKHIIEKEKEIK